MMYHAFQFYFTVKILSCTIGIEVMADNLIYFKFVYDVNQQKRFRVFIRTRVPT
jgi:hypothetical protein